jgi:hypothetical protein
MYHFLVKVVRRARRRRWNGWLPPIAIAGC